MIGMFDYCVLKFFNEFGHEQGALLELSRSLKVEKKISYVILLRRWQEDNKSKTDVSSLAKKGAIVANNKIASGMFRGQKMGRRKKV
ncbi:hypothetical protein SLEP1_g17452 [Rubroshorea leprosula]|uniref:Uncharacterized protein n=1 Tax=Rubroshorea leprosula TaxID=152421 RepID=A0AAV5IUB5_9ROSI|nr:hypothetical protein SLEP1_g17452 [Rubroshorea leprosula]